MTTDETTIRIFDWIIAAISALLGLLWKANSDSLKKLQEDHTTISGEVREIELLVAGSYVKRDEMEKMISALFTKLDKIEAKIDQKADK
jgi:hypothetical protein